MFSKSLFKKTVKDNWKFWLGITLGLAVMMVILLAVANNYINNPPDRPDFDPSEFAMDNIFDQYYTMFAMMIPMIYIVMTGNKLIAAQIDKGSLAYLMSKPVKRNQVSLTQAIFFIGSIVAMFAVITVVGLAMIGILGIKVEIGSFLLLNLGIILFHLAISGISYLASCIFNFSSKSLLIGAGIPVMFFVFNMLAGFSEMASIMENFKYLTINSLYNVTDIMTYSTNMIWQFGILLAIAAVCYTTGVLYFKKKDLPL